MSEISARIKTALLYTAESVERPHFEAEADAWIEQLRAESATEERERLHAIAALSSEPADAARLQGDPGLLREDIELLTHAVTHLLSDHDCDRHGWETLQATNERVRAALAATPAEQIAAAVEDERLLNVGDPTEDFAATPAEPEAIDVERLARAMFWEQENTPGGARRGWSDVQHGVRIGWTESAARIAAEYARLSNPAQRETPEGAVE